MSKWELAYKQAEKQMKEKIMEDVERYLEIHDQMPLLERYLQDRSPFLRQVWINIWVNKITSLLSIEEKHRYLIDQELIDRDIDKKTIKKLFKKSIKPSKYFDFEGWLREKFNDLKVWEETYNETKTRLLRRIEKQNMQEKRALLKQNTNVWFEQLTSQFSEEIYVYIRYFLTLQLFSDIQNKPNFKLIGNQWQNEKLVRDGNFEIQQFKYIKEFFEEYTGDIVQIEDWGRLYYDYEQYSDHYWESMTEYTQRAIEELFSTSINGILGLYNDLDDYKLTIQQIFTLIDEESLIDINNRYFELYQNEYVEDLIKFVAEPFEFETHRQLYQLQLEEVVKRQREEEELRRRKVEEEQRMLADVFEREFQPTKSRSVQFILHIGDTNTGKTFHALQKMKQADSGCYLAPLRLLALEVFDTLNNEGIPCSLKTGEEEKYQPSAKHLACTVEMFYEKDRYDCIVIDEAQMIADKERGFAWYKAITKANANEVHIIGSRNCKDILLSLLEDSPIEIIEYEREVPLKVEKNIFKIEHAKKGDALITFSRKKVLETAALLQQKGKKVSMIYGSMPPETRKAQITRFIKGETMIIVSTDAIGMGLNLPIKRIAFLENEKFDGTSRRRLTSQEVKQVAGRAGRKGIYNVGNVAFTQDISKMKSLLEKEDQPITTFTIAPTPSMFERFQRYSRDLGKFFALWEQFQNPKGTIKASLAQEKELYDLVHGTEIEARLSMDELFSFLHLPFSSKDPGLIDQWLETMKAIVSGTELPEPIIKRDNLDDVEYTYKAIGLHLLFLYKLGDRTEAIYWERLRKEISEDADSELKKAMRKMKKTCKRCGKKMPLDYQFPICQACFTRQKEQSYY